MADNLKKIVEQVSTHTNSKEAAVALVNGVADQLDGLTHDPVAIKALADELRKGADELGAAICKNTSLKTPDSAAEHPSTQGRGTARHGTKASENK